MYGARFWKCGNCAKRWFGRTPAKPKRCPACGSRDVRPPSKKPQMPLIPPLEIAADGR